MKREKGQHRETVEKSRGESPRVFLKRGPDGEWRRQWVGRWSRDGKRRDVTLCRWAGKPPETSTGTGDPAFERSRERAKAMLADAIREDEEKGREEIMVQRVHAIRYGVKVGRVKIAELRARWDALPHKAEMTEGWKALVHCVLKRFEDYMSEHFPKVKEAGALTPEHFKGFFAWVDKLGISGRAWNYHLTILRGTLAKVDGQSRGFREYLAQLPKRTENTVHRRPFTGEELDAIFTAAAKVDPELHSVLVAAACTALSRGDVARLKWKDVDLAEGFVTVKRSKTGETVDIPIFPPFMAVLSKAEQARRKGVSYVFPGVALAYQRNPDALNVRLRNVLAAAGFVPPEQLEGGKYPAPASPADAVEKVGEGMRRDGWTDARREKGLAILARHLKGEKGVAIAAGLGISRPAVSEYLHEMEAAGNVALVTPPKADAPRQSTLVEDGSRKRRGSLCGWHSFRTTFCTLALANGVPMEILRKITGHRTAEIVLKYYDRRGREAMRKVMGTAMPKAIAGAVGGGAEIPPELAAMLANADKKTLAAVKRLLKKGSEK